MPFPPADAPLKHTNSIGPLLLPNLSGFMSLSELFGERRKRRAQAEKSSVTLKVEHLDLSFYRCLSWGNTKGKVGKPEEPLPSPASKPQHENQQPSSSGEKSPFLRKALVFSYSFYKCDSPDVTLPLSLLIITEWREGGGQWSPVSRKSVRKPKTNTYTKTNPYLKHPGWMQGLRNLLEWMWCADVGVCTQVSLQLCFGWPAAPLPFLSFVPEGVLNLWGEEITHWNIKISAT